MCNEKVINILEAKNSFLCTEKDNTITVLYNPCISTDKQQPILYTFDIYTRARAQNRHIDR